MHHAQDNYFELTNKNRLTQSKTLGAEHNVSLLLLSGYVSCALRKGIFFFSHNSKNIVAVLSCSHEAEVSLQEEAGTH